MNIKQWFNGVVLSVVMAPLSVLAAPGDFFLTLVNDDGSATRTIINGFKLGLEGEEPNMALLLPAVQAAREAARQMEDQIVKNEPISGMIIQSNTPGSYYRYELKNVFVTSYSTSGDSSGGETVPVEQFSLNYEEIKVTYNSVIRQYDCTSGICFLQR